MFEYLFSIILDIYLGVELLGHMVTLFNLLSNCWGIFHNGYTILHFLQHCVRVHIFLANAYYFPLKKITAILVGTHPFGSPLQSGFHRALKLKLYLRSSVTSVLLNPKLISRIRSDLSTFVLVDLFWKVAYLHFI